MKSMRGQQCARTAHGLGKYLEMRGHFDAATNRQRLRFNASWKRSRRARLGLAGPVTGDRAPGASFTCYRMSKGDNGNQYGSGASSDYDPRDRVRGPSVSSLQFLLGNRAMPCALLPRRRIVREPIVVHSPKVVQTFAYSIDAMGPLYAHTATLLRRAFVRSA
jgi:hypothetical protein